MVVVVVGVSVWKSKGVCCWPLKIGPQQIEAKSDLGQKDGSFSTPKDCFCVGELHATHPLMLMIICIKYVQNAHRIVDFMVKAEKLESICENIEIL